MLKIRLFITLGFIGVLLALSASWSAAYFITKFIYSYQDYQPSELVRQLINSLVGFFIFGIGMFTITHLTPFNKRRHVEFNQSIVNAMKQVARGDYNVNLKKISEHRDPNDPFGVIVDNFNDMAKELGQMEQMRQQFVSNVSHEIQSPLTSISGFARALQNDQLSYEERMHYLKIIETESGRLSKISDNLLKLTYLESEHHSIETNRYRLDRQLRESVLSCEPQWVDKDIEMELTLDEVTINADKELMDQVWLNLLNNAIKFTPRGGKIGVNILQREHEIVVEVFDSGIGISEEEQLHLYERFYKADKARNRTTSGSGLGLSIVKKIVDLHSGTISVKSKENEGAIFIVSLKT